jgi:hypothetical protein
MLLTLTHALQSIDHASVNAAEGAEISLSAVQGSASVGDQHTQYRYSRVYIIPRRTSYRSRLQGPSLRSFAKVMAGFYPSDVTKAREIEKDNGKLRSRKQSEGGRQEVVKCARAGYASRLRPCPSYQHRRCFQCPWMARLPFRRPCLCPWVFAEGCCQHFAWPIGDHMPVKGDMISAVITSTHVQLTLQSVFGPSGP